ncbi:hypothetical protein [Azotobacter vinelandii]|uniref:hypothetical protein n=1 Tax=Azotobacter vinelandii TaxID=354 RepID=UPI0026657B74|nr:hypothetical protein [Azotobacter vinelandii]WKN21523.1 hypothetical protein AVAEIV_004623 [Azotobacter vinelandii]
MAPRNALMAAALSAVAGHVSAAPADAYHPLAGNRPVTFTTSYHQDREEVEKRHREAQRKHPGTKTKPSQERQDTQHESRRHADEHWQ